MEDHRNLSRTPPAEVGGLALFDGVLMRSRTGCAVARRLDDGTISVVQIPDRSIKKQVRGLRSLPFSRGIFGLLDLLRMGSEALTNNGQPQDSPDESKQTERNNRLIGASIILFLTLLFVLPPIIIRGITGIEAPVQYALLEALTRFVVLISYAASLSLSSDIRTIFRFHGAEHQAVAAFEKRRDVTVSLASSQEITHPRCGTTLLAMILILSIPSAILIAVIVDQTLWAYGGIIHLLANIVYNILAFPILLILAFELTRFAARNRQAKWARLLLQVGIWMQRLTTRTPDDKQREVAIVALYAALAIAPKDEASRSYRIKGLEDDETAPGYRPRSPARTAEKENMDHGGQEATTGGASGET